jgi:hypothetical protein
LITTAPFFLNLVYASLGQGGHKLLISGFLPLKGLWGRAKSVKIDKFFEIFFFETTCMQEKLNAR